MRGLYTVVGVRGRTSEVPNVSYRILIFLKYSVKWEIPDVYERVRPLWYSVRVRKLIVKRMFHKIHERRSS